MRLGKCINLLASRVASQSDLPAESTVLSNRDVSTDLSSHVSLSSEASRFDSNVLLSASTCVSTCSDVIENSPAAGCNGCNDIDGLMCKAYGAPLLSSNGSPTSSPWFQRWNTIIHHRGHHYLLPGGSVGKKYVELLNQELQYFVSGSFPAERVIVFSSLMLQRDRLVHKACDVRRLLDRRMSLWNDGQFDVLLQEAIRCDKVFHSGCHPSFKNHTDHITRVFTKLMLEGNVRAQFSGSLNVLVEVC